MKTNIAFAWLLAAFAACTPPGKPCVANGPRLLAAGPATLPSIYEALGVPGSGAIVGYVSDSETGQGLSTAVVTLRKDSVGPPLKIASADSLGGFVLNKIEPGRYVAEVRAITYVTTFLHVTARNATVDTMRFGLVFNPGYLSCVKVTTS